MMRFAKVLLLFFLLLTGCSLIRAQCGLNESLLIQDLRNQAGYIRIDNAVNDDLSSPAQGICKIRIRFRHESVGEFKLILIAPDLTRYELMSPGGTRPTKNTLWDIEFLPCGVPSNPDPINFIKPVWDSDQNWGEGNNYSGSYHPEVCLEEINSGTVNGLWTIFVADQTAPGKGEIESFDIEFCDPRGINCGGCVFNGGRLTIDTIPVCGGDPSLRNILIFPTYTGIEPDPALYAYTYVVIHNNIIVEIDNRPDLSNEPAGDYRILGLSVFKDDLPDVLALEGKSLSVLSGAINRNQPQLCAAFSNGHKLYRLLSDPDPRYVIQKRTCLEAPLEFDGKRITTPGVYEATFTSSTGCDSTVEMHVSIFDVNTPIVNPGTISCNNKPLTLSWTNVIFENPRYQWFTRDGSILGTVNTANIQIDLPGEYALSVAENGCSDTVVTTVGEDGSLPSLLLDDVEMNCEENIGKLRPVSDANSFFWTGPNNFKASTKDVDVLQPGKYTLTATGTNCAVRKSINVFVSFDKPGNITAQGDTMFCYNDSLTLEVFSVDSNITYSWLGPNGFTSNKQFPKVTEPGKYTARVVSENTCSIDTVVEVIKAFFEPTIQLTGGTIDCANPTVRIQTQFADNQAQFKWNGPGGWTSNAKSPSVKEPGMYMVSITDQNGCIYNADVSVAIDTIHPTVLANDIQLNCTDQDFQLNATTITVLHSPPNIRWSGPNGYSDVNPTATAQEAGTYTLRVEDPVNHCVASTSIKVNPAPDQPKLAPESGTIHCEKRMDTVRVTANNCQGNCGFEWFDAKDVLISTDDSLVTSAGGKFNVRVTGATGCISWTGLSVRVDTLKPVPNVLITPVGCSEPGVIDLKNPATLRDYAWFDSTHVALYPNTPSVTVTDTTLFFLYLEGKNFCTDTQQFIVGTKKEAPLIKFIQDTLDCAHDSIAMRLTLSNYPANQIQSYDWGLPGGGRSSKPVPYVKEPGTIEVAIIMKNGCLNQANTSVVTDFSTPDIMATGGSFSCKNPELQLGVFASRTPISAVWSGPVGFHSTQFDPLVSDTGKYYVTMLGYNGCPAFDTVTVSFSDPLPVVDLVGDTITCLDTIGNVTFNTNSPIQTFQWIDPGGRFFSSPGLETFVGGAYQFDLVDTNQCIFSGEVIVLFDTVSFGAQVTSEIISCLQPTTPLLLDTILPSVNYTWYFDSVFISDDLVPIVDRGGLYQLETSFTNGCGRVIQHQVEADTVSPSFLLTADTLDCSNDRITLRPSRILSKWIYEWVGPNGYTSSERTPLITNPGFYTLNAFDVNGCSHEEVVFIGSDFYVPEIDIGNTFLPCSADSAELVFSTPDTVKEINWFGPNGFYTNDPVIKTRVPGNYVLLAKGYNGCEIIDSVFISADPDLSPVEFLVQNIDCTHNEGFIKIENASPEFSYEWTDPMSNRFMDTLIRSTSPIEYLLNSIHLPSQCPLYDTVAIQVDTVVPQLRIFTMDSIVCDHREIVLESEVDRAVSYKWASIDGSIITNDTLSDILIDQPGTYMLSITDDTNHCTRSQELRIDEKESNFMALQLILEEASCQGDNNASITVENVIGGSGPFTFALDTQYFSLRKQYPFLKPGIYSFYAKDINGCTLDTLLELSREPRFDVTLGEDRVIELGDSIDLEAQVALSDSLISQVTWYLEDPIQCTPCPTQGVKPLKNIYYQIEVISASGCVVRDTIFVRVADRKGIFVPNAFTPNSDGNNDEVLVYAGPNIERIKSYRIYDRWGNNVFGAFDFSPGDTNAAWDGNYKNKPLNPGVFIYTVEALDIRGKLKQVVGEIMLLK